jgi:hypothetical protein
MPRHKKEQPFPAPFKQGDFVKVSQPGNFSGFHLGIITGMCKKNDGGIMVYLSGDNIITRDVCIQIDRGDTIQKITKSFDIDKT